MSGLLSLSVVLVFLVISQLISAFLFTLYFVRQKKKMAETNKKLKAANARIQQYLSGVDASNLMCIMDSTGVMKYINRAYLNAVGYNFEEVVGNKYDILTHPDTPQKTYEEMFSTLQEGQIWSGMILNQAKDGHTVYLETSVVPIRDDNNRITEYLSIRKDLTEVYVQQEQIKKQYTDPLTGFPNRTRMRLDLEKITEPALAIINIDSFSTINTYYGLEAGDEILKDFAKLLKSKLDLSMTAYRLSGDEFAVLADGINDINEFNLTIKHIMHEITEHRFHHDGNEIQLNLTSGTALGHDNPMVKAGMAIKQARQNKKTLTTYSEVHQVAEQMRETIQYTTALRDAVRLDRVVPHFQPIADTATGKIFKHEALIRIQDENGKFIPPMCFLELSKQLKLYNDLSSIMLMKTIDKIKDTDKRISFNFDKEDVLNQRMHNKLFDAVRKYGLQGRVTIEITESEGIDNLSELAAFVSKAKQEGCLIAIDDFGTGYSNFMYILSLQPDFLKIDGSITRQILESKRARLLTETIVSMCRRAGIKTIGEFVSSEEIYGTMKELGVDYVQGYYFGKPEIELL
ncbi:GGDEF and EAL domain-containing protein [Seleniivibrio woodruffii]|uniref:GGDEF and EAL domain-containing protein n=1 Tax=Seleniivibrio woodruffii TaxID=1078050 RepID=UPI0026EF1AC2|nr:GGDEF and EAL domain-containing protein [Seleniivibrio woodruffii]